MDEPIEKAEERNIVQCAPSNSFRQGEERPEIGRRHGGDQKLQDRSPDSPQGSSPTNRFVQLLTLPGQFSTSLQYPPLLESSTGDGLDRGPVSQPHKRAARCPGGPQGATVVADRVPDVAKTAAARLASLLAHHATASRPDCGSWARTRSGVPSRRRSKERPTF